MKASLVCPIHNEASMLPYTLRSMLSFGCDEVLFGLDRCSDESEDMILAASKAIHPRSLVLRRFNGDEGADWRFRPAYLRRELYGMAENDVILNTSGDIWLDPKMGRHLDLIPNNYGLISFHYFEKPWNIQCFERALITKFVPGFAGLLAFSKKAWLDTEDMENLKLVKLGEDTHLQLAIKKKYRVRHIHSRSLHLRPNEEKSDHYLRGTIQWDRLHNPMWKTFIHAVAMIRPAVLVGYCHARYGASFAAKATALPVILPLAVRASMQDTPEEYD